MQFEQRTSKESSATAGVKPNHDPLAPPPSLGPLPSSIHEKTTTNASTDQMQQPSREAAASVVHDLIAGGVAGSVSIFVGHPFDTAKVRLQASKGNISMSRLATEFGGFWSLFRGIGPPLSTAVFINATIFSSYGFSARIWDKTFVNQAHLQQQLQHDPWTKAFACGCFSGLVQAHIVCPMEHVKCRIQVQHGVDNIYKGPTDAIKSIYRSHGIQGLYRGYAACLWREIPAFGAYFATYDYLKDWFCGWLGSFMGEGRSHTWWASGMAGGIAGCSTWAMIYPMDVIKTRIQTSSLDTRSSILGVGRQLVNAHGWTYLFRGLGVTLARAFPVNGIIFPVYEFTLMHVVPNTDLRSS